MVDVWDAARRGYGLGTAIRDARNEREQARAYGEGGWDAARAAAVRRGDMGGVMRATEQADADHRRQMQRRTETLQWFRTNAPMARNVLRAARNMTPERRGPFLQGQAQRFLEMGFDQAQIDQALAVLTGGDEAAAAAMFEELDAAFGQYEQPDWSLETVLGANGAPERRAVAIGADGAIMQGPNALPAEGGGGGRIASPEEVAAYGFRPGTVVWIEPGKPPRPLQQPLAPRAGAQGGQYPDDGYEYFPD